MIVLIAALIALAICVWLVVDSGWTRYQNTGSEVVWQLKKMFFFGISPSWKQGMEIYAAYRRKYWLFGGWVVIIVVIYRPWIIVDVKELAEQRLNRLKSAAIVDRSAEIRIVCTKRRAPWEILQQLMLHRFRIARTK